MSYYLELTAYDAMHLLTGIYGDICPVEDWARSQYWGGELQQMTRYYASKLTRLLEMRQELAPGDELGHQSCYKEMRELDELEDKLADEIEDELAADAEAAAVFGKDTDEQRLAMMLDDVLATEAQVKIDILAIRRRSLELLQNLDLEGLEGPRFEVERAVARWLFKIHEAKVDAMGKRVESLYGPSVDMLAGTKTFHDRDGHDLDGHDLDGHDLDGHDLDRVETNISVGWDGENGERIELRVCRVVTDIHLVLPVNDDGVPAPYFGRSFEKIMMPNGLATHVLLTIFVQRDFEPYHNIHDFTKLLPKGVIADGAPQFGFELKLE